MKLTLVINSLAAGGAERVAANMANHWSKAGHAVEFLIFLPDGSRPFYALERSIGLRTLGLDQSSSGLMMGIFNNLRRIRVLRRAIIQSRPDIVLSFMDRTNVLVAFASAGLGIPVVLSERNDPAVYLIGGRGWEWLRSRAYSRADCVVAQTKAALSYFDPEIQRRGVIIPNAIPSYAAGAGANGLARCNNKIIAVGRLTPQKGFDLLLQAFSTIEVRFPEWSLTIWGEGPERPALEELRDSLGLKDRVRFPGVTKDVPKELRESNLFVLSSRFEGFPNALLEAMACNLPVISFDCPSGPREIIRHNVDGLLVPPQDVRALSGAMDLLMGNPPLRSRLSARAAEVLDRFSVEKVMAQWDQLLGTVIRGK